MVIGNKKWHSIFAFVFGVAISIICCNILDNKCKKNININKIDTTYNKVLLDSIEYNIELKCSTIVELKKLSKYETEQAINSNDSAAIEQFKSLAGAD